MDLKTTSVLIPPIKCQGIKSKLVPFISSNIKWDGRGTWFEPFMGSGVVTFNIRPKVAVISDINPHLINFYNEIKEKIITPQVVRTFLETHGKKLSQTGKSIDSYYYEMRSIFNETHDPLYFLFLNRSCFNGLIRFNDKEQFNTPFCRKPNRFSKGYISKIVNQVAWVFELLKDKDYEFKCLHWSEVIRNLTENDFVYIDTPYFGRHATYYNNWKEKDALELLDWAIKTKSGYAISLWYENRHRKNEFIEKYWKNSVIRLYNHYYFLGSKEKNRYKMQEALIIKPEYSTDEVPSVIEPFKNYKD